MFVIAYKMPFPQGLPLLSKKLYHFLGSQQPDWSSLLVDWSMKFTVLYTKQAWVTLERVKEGVSYVFFAVEIQLQFQVKIKPYGHNAFFLLKYFLLFLVFTPAGSANGPPNEANYGPKWG
jgi:hypothetical protein